jgi:hypothetical protein
MKPFSLLFWVVLLVGVALVLLLLNVLDFREARTVKTVMVLVLVSFLYWLKGRSRADRR